MIRTKECEFEDFFINIDTAEITDKNGFRHFGIVKDKTQKRWLLLLNNHLKVLFLISFFFRFFFFFFIISKEWT